MPLISYHIPESGSSPTIIRLNEGKRVFSIPPGPLPPTRPPEWPAHLSPVILQFMATPQEIAEEDRKIRQLQRTVDLALFYIAAADIDREKAEKMVHLVRAKALDLFPDKAETFDLIYHPRFTRLLNERFGAH